MLQIWEYKNNRLPPIKGYESKIQKDPDGKSNITVKQELASICERKGKFPRETSRKYLTAFRYTNLYKPEPYAKGCPFLIRQVKLNELRVQI